MHLMIINLALAINNKRPCDKERDDRNLLFLRTLKLMEKAIEDPRKLRHYEKKATGIQIEWELVEGEFMKTENIEIEL